MWKKENILKIADSLTTKQHLSKTERIIMSKIQGIELLALLIRVTKLKDALPRVFWHWKLNRHYNIVRTQQLFKSYEYSGVGGELKQRWLTHFTGYFQQSYDGRYERRIM